jgi:hypothetical protein
MSNQTQTGNGSSWELPPAQAELLGEVVAWDLPAKVRVAHQDLAAALSGAELDPSLARNLNTRHAFVRACRQMAQDRIITNVYEDKAEIPFQLNVLHTDVQSRRADFDYEATVSLDKATGTVRSTDAGIEALARHELAEALRVRRTDDVTRLLHQLFARGGADLFPVKGGTYFVPAKYADLLDKVGVFLSAIGGRLSRYPVPKGTRQGDQAVSQVVYDGLYAAVDEYEEAINGLTCDSTEQQVVQSWKKLQSAGDKIETYRGLLGSHAARLEDHLAWVENLLRRKQQERAAANQAGSEAVPA